MSQPPEELVKSIGCTSGDEPLDVFPRSARGVAGYWAGLSAFALLGALFLGVGVWGAADSPPPERPWFVAGGVAAMLAFFGAGWFWWAAHYRSTADLVYLYDTGLVWRTPRGGWAAGRWADAGAVWRRDTMHEAGPEVSRVRVEFASGPEARCAAQLGNYLGLADQIQRAVHRHLFPGMKARFDAGEPVEFGPVTLTKDELVAEPTAGSRGGRCPLAEVREVALAVGCLWVNHLTRGLKSVGVALSDVPNYTILIALLPLKPPGWDVSAFE